MIKPPPLFFQILVFRLRVTDATTLNIAIVLLPCNWPRGQNGQAARNFTLWHVSITKSTTAESSDIYIVKWIHSISIDVYDLQKLVLKAGNRKPWPTPDCSSAAHRCFCTPTACRRILHAVHCSRTPTRCRKPASRTEEKLLVSYFTLEG
jgi:hypothetical protein